MNSNNENLSSSKYIDLTTELNVRVKEVAQIVTNKMDALQLKEISALGVELKLIKHKANGFSEEHLSIWEDEEEYTSLEATRFYYACANNFNCPVYPSSIEKKTEFLKVAKDIIQKLDEIEEEKCEEIKFALLNSKDIK